MPEDKRFGTDSAIGFYCSVFWWRLLVCNDISSYLFFSAILSFIFKKQLIYLPQSFDF